LNGQINVIFFPVDFSVVTILQKAGSSIAFGWIAGRGNERRAFISLGLTRFGTKRCLSKF